MDRILEEALRPVLADLGRTGTPVPRVQEEDWGHPELHATAILWAEDGTGAGVSVSRDSSPQQRVVEAADMVQDRVIEDAWGRGRATAWPPCPAHPDTHPMRPELRGSESLWTCPRDVLVEVPIGLLGA